jgi:hypothetical protein
MPKNLTTWGLPALLPIREEGVLRIFIALKNPSPWPVFEPATFWSSGQHTNHYTTKATYLLSDTKNQKLVSRPTAEEERKVSHPVTVQDVGLIVVLKCNMSTGTHSCTN